MAQVRGLGRGLDALLGGSHGGGADGAEAIAAEVHTLTVTSIRPNPEQPRRHFTEDALAELADSIRSRGVLQPLLVRPFKGDSGEETGRYEIVAGERRWRASQMAGLAEVPVVVREMTDNESLAIALIENLQREDLNPIEEAKGFRELQSRLACSQDELAKQVGKSRSAVANALRLLNLPDDIQQEVYNGTLSAGHGRVLAGVEDESARRELCKRIAQDGHSVRQAEQLATRLRTTGSFEQEEGSAAEGATPSPGTSSRSRVKDEDLARVSERLAGVTGCRVAFSGTADKGKLTFAFSSREELKALVHRLAKQQGGLE